MASILQRMLDTFIVKKRSLFYFELEGDAT